MATGWVKAMQCRSSDALEGVFQHQPPLAATSRKEKAGHILPLGCRFDASVHHCAPKNTSCRGHHSPTLAFPAASPKPQRRRPVPKPNPKTKLKASKITAPTLAPSPARQLAACGPFPTLASLPPGHSSRRVVEIIFSSSWSPTSHFPGHVELIFRIHVPSRSVGRFEEYRDAVRQRAGDADPRCAADGNELMQFHAASALLAPVADPSSSSSLTSTSASGQKKGGSTSQCLVRIRGHQPQTEGSGHLKAAARRTGTAAGRSGAGQRCFCAGSLQGGW